MKQLESFFPGYEFKELISAKGRPFSILHNATFSEAVPLVNSLAFFNEHDFFAQSIVEKRWEELQAATEQKALDYERFVRQKGRRPNHDIYACFQPFNEAFKAFFPFIKILRKRLKKGELIVNLWDRTGWSAALLAGLFPEQKVVNLWEGDKDVLGYKGFYFWYAHADLPVQAAFANLDKKLPFEDDSVGLVLGLDTFHRFDQSHLIQELLRITTSDAAILFPHVHLSNNEPDPWFERGCRQLHGTDYAAYFEHLLKHTDRAGYVFPEPEMFAFNELYDEPSRPITSNPSSHHYNAMIAILPTTWEKEERLAPFRMRDLSDPSSCHILINPLLRIDLAEGRVHLDRGYLSERVGYLLERHPIYVEKLNKANQYELKDWECILIYWAFRCKSVRQIAQILDRSIDQILDSLEHMQQCDILQLVPVHAHFMRLQYYVSTQQYVLPAGEQTLRALWDRAVANFQDDLFLLSALDESELSYGECATIIAQIQGRLQQANIRKGETIAFLCKNHFEAILTILACTQIGIIAVPMDTGAGAKLIAYMLEDVLPKLIFTDLMSWQKHQHLLDSYDAIVFDEEEPEVGSPFFSDWLMECTTTVDLPLLNPQDTACILYTSGSTGQPKGVPLNHGQLVRSGRLISETFQWQSTDRYFSPADLDSMSGLRNACIAPLEVGAAVIIPNGAEKQHLFALTECMQQYGATILGTTPALVGQLAKYHRRVKGDLDALRQVICTGSKLGISLKREWDNQFNIPLINYYGLTETTGICLSEAPDDPQIEENTVGIPVGCIAQIVDEQGKVLKRGEQGQLRIYSENLMGGYWKNREKTLEMISEGWLYTGDIAQFHENGHIRLLGRQRDILKLASGQLVFAGEIEQAIKVSNEAVEACAVIGVEEEETEKIIAFLQLKEGFTFDEELQKHIKSHLLDSLGEKKMPHRWRVLTEFPKTRNGKILKTTLKTMLSA